MHQGKKSFKDQTVHRFSTGADCSFAASLRTAIAARAIACGATRVVRYPAFATPIGLSGTGIGRLCSTTVVAEGLAISMPASSNRFFMRR